MTVFCGNGATLTVFGNISKQLGERETHFPSFFFKFRTGFFLLAILITGMPPPKWSTFWDMIIPFSGGLNDGWKAREARGYRAEAATG